VIGCVALEQQVSRSLLGSGGHIDDDHERVDADVVRREGRDQAPDGAVQDLERGDAAMARRIPRSGRTGRHRIPSTEAKGKRPIGHTARGAGRRIRKLLEDQDVAAHIVQLVPEIYGPNALREAWDEFRCWDREAKRETPLEFTADSSFLEHFISWLAHTWTPAMLSEEPKGVPVPDEVPTQTFLARHPDVHPLLARFLTACIETPFSFYEVPNRDVGQSFTCRDLICGTRHVVIESLASTLLRIHQNLYARIVEMDGVPVIEAAAPWPLPEDLKPAILALREEILGRSSGVRREHARQSLLAHELQLRAFYWGFVEQAFKEGSLRPQVRYTHGLYNAAEHLLMTLAPGRTVAGEKSENEVLSAIPDVRQQVVSIFTGLYENWVNERLPVLGNKTALEAVATPEGQLKVAALLAEIESDLSLLPFSLDPQVFRRMRERLGIFPTEGLH
jgi:hypothetical protein